MAQRRILSTEDLGSTGRISTFTDIDLTLARKETGDVFKKFGVNAIRQSIRTILLSNHGDKPFNPTFGANIRGLLFELFDEDDDDAISNIRTDIRNAIALYEPRVRVNEIMVRRAGANALSVKMVFRMINSAANESASFETILTRLR